MSADKVKNSLFYTMVFGSVYICFKWGKETIEHRNMLKADFPECMKSNPWFYHLIIGTCLTLMVIQYPI